MVPFSVKSFERDPVFCYFFTYMDSLYGYPDEDICLFKYFDHRQALLSCRLPNSCVQEHSTWLALFSTWSPMLFQRIWKNSSSKMFSWTTSMISQTMQRQGSNVIWMPGLRSVIWKSSTLPREIKNPEFANEDMVYHLLIAEFIGPIVSFPIISLVGFGLNLLICLVIHNKKNQKNIFKGERIYKYMSLNALFNMIECLISMTILTRECLGPHSIYCASTFKMRFFVAFNEYVAGYLGDCMKTCSILTALIFSLERYLITLNSNQPFCKKFQKIKIRYFIVGIVSISALSSTNKLFEMKPIPVNSGFDMDLFDFNTSIFKVTWFRILHCVHYVFNDFILVVINIVIDILLVKLIRRDLRIKLNFSINSLSIKPDHMKKTLEEVKKAEENTNKMIIFLFLIYFLCRIPELIFSIILLFRFIKIKDTFFKMCSLTVCQLLNNIIQYTYMLSYITNIFFYIKFNRPFRHGLKCFFGEECDQTFNSWSEKVSGTCF